MENTTTALATKTEQRGDIAVAAMAAKTRAEIESRYVIALQRPRNIMLCRSSILDSCRRPAFCEGAIYRKPVGGGKTVDGFSIRFAEEAIKALRNISVDTMAIYEDDERLTIRISVTDLEANLSYADEARITKTVERRSLKDGQQAISERMNSTGQKVYIVAATDDDLLNKINAAKSKAIRNSGLRLVPQDILEEAWNQILDTMEKGGGDPAAEVKKVCDAFGALRVSPSELEKYLGHSIDTVSKKELTSLRGIYTAIKDEETTWAAVMETATPKKPVATGAPVDVAATVTSITNAGLSGEELFKAVTKLCVDSQVTEPELLAYCKGLKPPLCKADAVEAIQLSDATLRQLHQNWANILPAIKAVKA